MKSIGQKIAASAAIAIAMTSLALQANAAPVVHFLPASQDAVGPTASVDIYVSGLDKAVGSVALSLSFNSGVLSGNSYTVDPTGVMQVANDFLNDSSAGFGVGTLGLAFTYDLGPIGGLPTFANEAALYAAEGGGADLKLATLTFNILNPGLSPLHFTGLSLAGYFDSNNPNAADLGATSADGSICVPGGCSVTVPEPSAALLVAVALGGLALSRRRVKGA